MAVGLLALQPQVRQVSNTLEHFSRSLTQTFSKMKKKRERERVGGVGGEERERERREKDTVLVS